MKKILFLICVLSLFSAGLVSAAHAHDGEQSTSHQIELSLDQHNSDTEPSLDPLCDIHAHSYMVSMDVTQSIYLNQSTKLMKFASDRVVSAPIYGLKRPPRV